mmetsp:Transcript_32985/g.94740  ORF Transcript_32985/g.94740 Transcript_32985/m.94740 type:complete len:172 (-) Transcript_32985:248-763(-)
MSTAPPAASMEPEADADDWDSSRGRTLVGDESVNRALAVLGQRLEELRRERSEVEECSESCCSEGHGTFNPESLSLTAPAPATLRGETFDRDSRDLDEPWCDGVGESRHGPTDLLHSALGLGIVALGTGIWWAISRYTSRTSLGWERVATWWPSPLFANVFRARVTATAEH